MSSTLNRSPGCARRPRSSKTVRPLSQLSSGSSSRPLAASSWVATITGGSGSVATREPVSIRTPSRSARARSRSTNRGQPPSTNRTASGRGAVTRIRRSQTNAADSRPGIVVVGGDAEGVGRGPGGHRPEPRTRPRVEVLVHRGAQAAVHQHPGHRERGQRAQLTLPAQPSAAHLAQPQPGDRAEQVPLGQPGPVRPIGVEGVGSLVGHIWRWQGPAPAAQLAVGLVQHDRDAALGRRDRGDQPGQSAPDDGDLLRYSECHTSSTPAAGLDVTRAGMSRSVGWMRPRVRDDDRR